MITYIFEIIVFLFCYLIIFRLDDFKILRIVAVFINTCLILEVINKIRYKLQEKRNMKIAEEKEEILYKYYKVTKENNEKVCRIKHDLKNQIQVAYAMKNKGISILEEVDNEINNVHSNLYSLNDVLNMILILKEIEARKYNINIVYKVDKNILLDNMNDYDVCKLFSNILDNSIEESKKTSDKKLILSLYRKNDYVILKYENTYDGKVKKDDFRFFTTKENKKEHGYGIKIIKSIVNKYDGDMNIQEKNGIFKVVIILNNKKMTKNIEKLYN